MRYAVHPTITLLAFIGPAVAAAPPTSPTPNIERPGSRPRPAKLGTLYPSHAADVAKVETATRANLRQGVILPADGARVVEAARQSAVGVR